MPSAASFTSCLPTGIEPVNETLRMIGEAMRCVDTSCGTPNTMASTPFGRPASCSARATASAVPGGFFGGLEDAAAAGGQRRADLARGIADRKIPRRERRHRAHGLLDDGHALAGQALRQHAPIRAPAFFRVPVEDFRRGLHFDARLVNALAHLERRDARDLLAARAHEIRGLLEDLAALHRQQRAPFAPGALRGGQRAIEIGGAGMRQLAQHFFGGRIDHRLGLAALRAQPFAVDEQREFRIVGRGRSCGFDVR